MKRGPLSGINVNGPEKKALNASITAAVVDRWLEQVEARPAEHLDALLRAVERNAYCVESGHFAGSHPLSREQRAKSKALILEGIRKRGGRYTWGGSVFSEGPPGELKRTMF